MGGGILAVESVMHGVVRKVASRQTQRERERERERESNRRTLQPRSQLGLSVFQQFSGRKTAEPICQRIQWNPF